MGTYKVFTNEDIKNHCKPIKKRICFRRLLTDLQGDVKVSSYQGNIISSKRFMGPNLELDTDNGDIRGNFNLSVNIQRHVYL